jgi:hypothetical protein
MNDEKDAKAVGKKMGAVEVNSIPRSSSCSHHSVNRLKSCTKLVIIKVMSEQYI